jgi:aspartyl-tRNA(Asn)/glutamyl-tRNA(Gln) amidotransferase subunit A
MRARWRRRVGALFDAYDILVAPATPTVAPRIEEGTILIDGQPVSARANLGIYCQPLSLVGVPVVAAPVHRNGLPIGVQCIAAPGREALLFDWLERLEAEGVFGAREAA